MTAPRDQLQSQWTGAGRHARFGDAIERMVLRGIRCHQHTVIDVRGAITAFSGLNGTGKSTLLQMAAVAYRNSVPTSTYYIRNFLISSRLDPNLFAGSTANISYQFCDATPPSRTLTLSYRASRRGWDGYRRRSIRTVFFCGIGNYIPRIEKRDFLIRHAKSLTIHSSTAATSNVCKWTCHVLGHQYAAVNVCQVSHNQSSQDVSVLRRSSTDYSEAHMGFGEGRAQYLIRSLESLPDKSLVLIEEPETSLHQRAQFGLGQYLVDVSNRKGHQIFLTTHSPYLLNALHSESRYFLYHSTSGVDTLHGVAAAHANSLLTEGYEKALTILVEDDCARVLLSELIRRVDPQLLSTFAIVVGGGASDLAATARAMKNAPIRVAVVRDGDQSATPRDFLFKLPGAKPPEMELLEDAAVQAAVDSRYGTTVANTLAANSGANHHDWFSIIASAAAASEVAIMEEASRAYGLGGTLANEAQALVDSLKDAASK